MPTSCKRSSGKIGHHYHYRNDRCCSRLYNLYMWNIDIWRMTYRWHMWFNVNSLSAAFAVLSSVWPCPSTDHPWSRRRTVFLYYFHSTESDRLSAGLRQSHAGVTHIFTADWRWSSRLVVSMLANSCQDQTAAGDMAAHCR